MLSCSDAKQFMDRHENLSTSSINEFLSEADCVNMSVMGDSWDKKPEDWVEDMRIVDAKTKREGSLEEPSRQEECARKAAWGSDEKYVSPKPRTKIRLILLWMFVVDFCAHAEQELG